MEQDGACLWLTCIQPSWSAYRAMHQGTLRLTFSDTGIQGDFLCGPAGGGTNDVTCTQGSVMDTFSIGFPGQADTVAPATTVDLRKTP